MIIGVVIADDQGLVRGGFRVLVDMAADMTVLAEASDGTEAVALARQHHPDVILMDVRMPRQDGIEATRQIKHDNDTAQTKVLILTTFDLDEYVYAALRAGASGFLLKDASPEKLLDAMRTRGPPRDRQRALQRRDRTTTTHQPSHRQDPHQPPPHETRRP